LFSSIPFPSSSTWKRKFSNKTIFVEPSVGSFFSEHSSSTSFPIQSFKKITFLFNNFSNLSATGANVNFGIIIPSGLPKII